jgi:aspartate kinase
MDLAVMKFGGTSVQDCAALRRLVSIVSAEHRARVVVVSALAGVTDALCMLADDCPPDATVQQVTERLCARHAAIISELVGPTIAPSLMQRVRLRFAAVGSILHDAGGSVMPRDRDALLAIGELASSEVIAAVLASNGVPARWIDARQVVVTDERFGSAIPDQSAIRQAAADVLVPALKGGEVPVLGGFVGASIAGATTTLGRGGSDYSAALIGAALDASLIQIWTDVDGVLTADPRSVAQPQLVRDLTFGEAYELARFGAKVLHWGTLEPAAAHDIPVHVLNAQTGASGRGTTVTAAHDGGPRIAGLAHQPDVAVLDARARDLTGSHPFLHAALEWLGRAGHQVTLVSLSPTRLTATARDASLLADAAAALQVFGRATILPSRTLVALVGEQASTHPEAWRIVQQQAPGVIECAIPAQSGHALVCMTDARRGLDLLRTFHERFFPARLPRRPASSLPLSAEAVPGAQSLSGVTQ